MQVIYKLRLIIVFFIIIHPESKGADPSGI